MKSLVKKSLLTLSILLSTQCIQTDGGGWAGGTALGLTSGLIIGSQMNRGSNNVDNSSAAAVSRELREVRREKRQLLQQYKSGKISQADYNQQSN